MTRVNTSQEWVIRSHQRTPCSYNPLMMDGSIISFSSISRTLGAITSFANRLTGVEVSLYAPVRWTGLAYLLLATSVLHLLKCRESSKMLLFWQVMLLRMNGESVSCPAVSTPCAGASCDSPSHLPGCSANARVLACFCSLTKKT